MKQIIIFLLFFLVSYSYSQDKDTLITPNIPFPEQLLNKKSGFLYVNFIINNKCQIINYYINSIYILYKKKSPKSGYENVHVFSREIPKENTKLGRDLVKKLDSWLKEFGSKTKYECSKNSDMYKLRSSQWAIFNHYVEFGDLLRKK